MVQPLDSQFIFSQSLYDWSNPNGTLTIPMLYCQKKRRDIILQVIVGITGFICAALLIYLVIILFRSDKV